MLDSRTGEGKVQDEAENVQRIRDMEDGTGAFLKGLPLAKFRIILATT